MGLFKDILEDKFNPLDALIADKYSDAMKYHYKNKKYGQDGVVTFPDKQLADQQLDKYKKAAHKSRLFGTPIEMPSPIFATVDEKLGPLNLTGTEMRGYTRVARNKPGTISKLFNPLTRGPSQIILKQQPPIKHGTTAVHEYTHAQDSDELYDIQFQPSEEYNWMDHDTNKYLGRGTEIHARLKEIDYLIEVLKASKPGSEDEKMAKEELDKVLYEVRPYIESFTEKYPDTNLSNFNSAAELIRESEMPKPINNALEEAFKNMFGEALN